MTISKKWVHRGATAVMFALHFSGTMAELDTDADGPSDYYSSGSSVPRPWTSQFETWYPTNAVIVQGISEGVCNLPLRDYKEAFQAPAGSDQASRLASICYRHESCIIDQLETSVALKYSSALVLLGLLPTLMAAIGPSIAELSVLSAHRPVLSFLISLGAPAIWPARVFEFDNPNNVLNIEGNRFMISSFSPRSAVIVTILQYALAAGAAVNVIYNAIEIGQNSVLAWACTTQFAPFLWVVLSGVVNTIGTVSYAIVRWDLKRRSRRSRGQDRLDSWDISGVLRRFVANELTICANRHDLYRHDTMKIPRIAVLFNIAAGCIGFVQLIYGTAVFSALQFITLTDVLSRIFLRLIGSAIVCRCIVIMEMAGLRRVTNQDLREGMVTSVELVPASSKETTWLTRETYAAT